MSKCIFNKSANNIPDWTKTRQQEEENKIKGLFKINCKLCFEATDIHSFIHSFIHSVFAKPLLLCQGTQRITNTVKTDEKVRGF